MIGLSAALVLGSVSLLVWGISGDGQVVLSFIVGGMTYLIPQLLSEQILRVRVLIQEVYWAWLFVEIQKVFLIFALMAITYFLRLATDWLSYMLGLFLMSQFGLARLILRKKSLV
ncbi:MAG: hypothetical protein WDW19_04765 [Neisseriaceae bacterium]